MDISKREAGPYSRHVRSLDGLRGMAVLAVMASHLFPGTTADRGFFLRSIGSSLRFGATGVDLFFVLSGFLITGILYDSLSDTGYFRKFYARRCLRIFPLYYGVLVVLFLFTPWLRIHWQHMQWSLLFYLQNTNAVMPLYRWHAGRVSIDHFWSLAVEEQFYLVWPLAVFLLSSRRKILWTSVTLSVAALLLRLFLAFHHTIFHVINRTTPCRADSLLIGAMLAILLRGSLHDVVLRYARPVFLWTVAITAGLNLLRIVIERRPDWLFAFDASYLALRYTLFAFGSATLIAWCLRPSSIPRALFERPVLRFFGKYSYGLYVLHLIILSLVLAPVRGWIDLHTSHKIIGVLGGAVVVFLVSVPAAYLSYNLYEKRFLGLKRYFEYARPGHPASRTEAAAAQKAVSST